MPDLNLTDPFAGYSGYNVSGFSSPTPQSAMPSALLYASMGLSSIAAIATTFGQVGASRAQREYEAGIARTNARIARIQARQAIESGDFAAARKNQETQQVTGSIRAAQGASGVDVASGSSKLVRNAVTMVGAMDELTIRHNAARQAWGYETEAIQDTYRGEFAQLRGKAQEEQSILSGGLKALSGPLSIGTNYMRWAKYEGKASGSRLPFDLVTG